MLFGWKTNNTNKGFTIVELLIVIVVIGILAAIVIVAYSGIQTRANNAARVAEAQQLAQLLDVYNTQNGQFPPVSAGLTAVCIGSGFADLNGDGLGDCWDANSASGSSLAHPDSVFNTALQTVGSLPTGNRTPIASGSYLRLGPVFRPSATSPTLRYWIQDSSCPVGTRAWSDAVTISCDIYLN